MNKGFTIIEVISAIVILALVIIIAMPAYNAMSRNLRQNNLNNKVNAIISATHRFVSENELDRIKPFGHTCTTAAQPCCLVFDLYDYIVHNGIYPADEMRPRPAPAIGSDPWILDPTARRSNANENPRLRGCVRVYFNIDPANPNRNNILISEFFRPPVGTQQCNQATDCTRPIPTVAIANRKLGR